MFFNHFIQPSFLPTAKLKSLLCVLGRGGEGEGSTPPIKMVPSRCGLPPYDDFKISLQPICSSKSHMTIMIRHHKNFPPTASSFRLFTRLFTAPRLTLDYYRGAASLITAFDTYLTSRSLGVG